MNKFFFLTLLVFVISITSVAASAVCMYNNLPFCPPTATTCVADGDTDVDNDAWTDMCDAFPNDATMWMDLDGDGVGYPIDCDDLDASVTCQEVVPEINDTNTTTPEINNTNTTIPEINNTNITLPEINDTNITLPDINNTNTTEANTTVNKTPTRRSASGGNSGYVLLKIEVPEQKEFENAPPKFEEQDSFIVSEFRTDNPSEPSKEQVNENEPTPIANQITGAVIGGGIFSWIWFAIAIMLISGLFLLVVWRKKRQNKDEN